MVLDKIFTLIVFTELQHVVQEWFPDEETLEDIYAHLITQAKKLAPLKSKAASNCVHPKASLKGGGNHASSYITCRMCHNRWENTMRSIRQKNIQSQVLQEALQKAEFEKMKEVGAVKTIDKPICLCGRPAELRAMKKEGPRRGRKYWNCAETACEFFQWLPTEADPDAMSVTSFNLGGNRDSSQRSKSPRTIRSEPKKTEGPIEVESDGTL